MHLGKRNYEVHVYEYREGECLKTSLGVRDRVFIKTWYQNEDIRKEQLVPGRSINLSLSSRGRKALAEVGLEEKLLQHGIPMRARMLHDKHGRTTAVPYDRVNKQVRLCQSLLILKNMFKY